MAPRAIIAGALLFFFHLQAYAYVTMIRGDYRSCTACHVNPSSGGLLTDYGRGIGATFSLFQEDYEKPEGPLIQHGAQVRLMTLIRDDGTDFFPMQIDYLNATKFSQEHRLEFAFGLQPARVVPGDAKFIDNFILRKATYNFRPADGHEITVGREFRPIGLFVDDHRAYIRLRNRRDVTDFVTLLKYQYWNEKNEVTPFVYIPSYQVIVGNQESGLGVRDEFYLLDNLGIGGSFLWGWSESVDRYLGTLFTRGGWHTFGYLLEYDFTRRVGLTGSKSEFNQHLLYFSPFCDPLEWLEVGPLVEFLRIEAPFSENRTRYGANVYLRFTHYVTAIFGYRFETVSIATVDSHQVQIQLLGHL